MPIQKTTPEEIIHTSIQVFRRQGYYRTNMSDLAKETGLTKGAFYHHFSNKEEVMRKALQATASWFEKKVFSIAHKDGLTNKEKLKLMSEISFKAFSEGDGGCFFANTVLETSHVEDTFLYEIEVFFDGWKNALKHIFQSSCMKSELDETVQAIIADIEGSIILMQLYKDNSHLQAALQRAFKKL